MIIIPIFIPSSGHSGPDEVTTRRGNYFRWASVIALVLFSLTCGVVSILMAYNMVTDSLSTGMAIAGGILGMLMLVPNILLLYLAVSIAAVPYLPGHHQMVTRHPLAILINWCVAAAILSLTYLYPLQWVLGLVLPALHQLARNLTGFQASIALYNLFCAAGIASLGMLPLAFAMEAFHLKKGSVEPASAPPEDKKPEIIRDEAYYKNLNSQFNAMYRPVK